MTPMFLPREPHVKRLYALVDEDDDGMQDYNDEEAGGNGGHGGRGGRGGDSTLGGMLGGEGEAGPSAVRPPKGSSGRVAPLDVGGGGGESGESGGESKGAENDGSGKDENRLSSASMAKAAPVTKLKSLGEQSGGFAI